MLLSPQIDKCPTYDFTAFPLGSLWLFAKSFQDNLANPLILPSIRTIYPLVSYG
jgi:hypothetical protein